MRVLKAGILYFAIVFAVAFVLGTVRTLALEPRLGKTWAVTLEIPFLIAAIVLAVRIVLRSLSPLPVRWRCLRLAAWVWFCSKRRNSVWCF